MLRSRTHLALALSCVAVVSAASLNKLRHHEIQVIGTHNSYHAGIVPNEAKIWKSKYPEQFKGLDYQHQPLPQQFDAGVRQIELDVYADTEGGCAAALASNHGN